MTMTNRPLCYTFFCKQKTAYDMRISDWSSDVCSSELPRIRNWKDRDFFRADKQTRYAHIDSLFHGAIDWTLIETHWKDLLQIAISIQAGKIASPMLLRRLGASSQRNRLFLAAQELGRAHRTVFLLHWIGSSPFRQEVTADANKIEPYTRSATFFWFGGEGI